PDPLVPWPLMCKFFDHLEANADELWQVPQAETRSEEVGDMPDEEEDDLYSAAYDNVTYRDSAEDGTEGSVAEGGGPTPTGEFDLENEGRRFATHVNFLATVGRLWLVVGRATLTNERSATTHQQPEPLEVFSSWLKDAREKQHRLEVLLDDLQAYPIPR